MITFSLFSKNVLIVFTSVFKTQDQLDLSFKSVKTFNQKRFNQTSSFLHQTRTNPKMLLRPMNDAQRAILRHYRQGLYAHLSESTFFSTDDLAHDPLLSFLVDSLDYDRNDTSMDELDACLLASHALQHALNSKTCVKHPASA